MTRASLLRRLEKLEDQRADRAKPDPVRVTITRHIVGADGQEAQTVRRTMTLYPDRMTFKTVKRGRR